MSYSRSDTELLAGCFTGFSNLITFVFAIIPICSVALFAIFDWEQGTDLEKPLDDLWAEGWIIVAIAVAIATVVSGLTGFLLTLSLRVIGHLLFGIAQIERNTCPKKQS